ncbi:EVE domain-containing protein [Candidatus Woesebacteria bacterium]|nr:EVE domain-containing protein [Candidatus Woesebacteria bacterium]
MQYFLAKTDPSTYSIDDLLRDHETNWDGVHNYQAIIVIKSWQVGDLVFVYHSQSDKKIMGVMKVVGAPYKDPTDRQDISWAARVQFVEKFAEDKQVSLKEIKESGLFANFLLVRNPRLSTMACPPEFVAWMKQK